MKPNIILQIVRQNNFLIMASKCRSQIVPNTQSFRFYRCSVFLFFSFVFVIIAGVIMILWNWAVNIEIPSNHFSNRKKTDKKYGLPQSLGSLSYWHFYYLPGILNSLEPKIKKVHRFIAFLFLSSPVSLFIQNFIRLILN